MSVVHAYAYVGHSATAATSADKQASERKADCLTQPVGAHLSFVNLYAYEFRSTNIGYVCVVELILMLPQLVNVGTLTVAKFSRYNFTNDRIEFARMLSTSTKRPSLSSGFSK